MNKQFAHKISQNVHSTFNTCAAYSMGGNTPGNAQPAAKDRAGRVINMHKPKQRQRSPLLRILIMFIGICSLVLAPAILLASSDIYGIVTETYPGVTLYNAPNADAVLFNDGCTILQGVSSYNTDYIEGGSSVMCVSSGSTNGGWLVRFGVGDAASPKDMSDYDGGFIEFNGRRTSGMGVTIMTSWNGDDGTHSLYWEKLSENADTWWPDNNQWYLLRQDLDDWKYSKYASINPFQIDKITFPVGFYREGSTKGTFWIDNVVWKKKNLACTGGTFSATVKKISNDAEVTSKVLSWSSSNSDLAAAREPHSGWRLANEYIQLDVSYYNACDPDYDPNSGVTSYNPWWQMQIYTDNMASGASPKYTGIPFVGTSSTNNPAGLVAKELPESQPVPLAWRIQWEKSPSNLTVKQGVDASSTCASGTTNSVATLKDRLWATYFEGSCYAAFSWMLDLNTKDNTTTTSTNEALVSNGSYNDYAAIWQYFRGIHHAEGNGTSTSWLGGISPNYLYIAADFSKALAGRTYKSNQIIIEIFYE